MFGADQGARNSPLVAVCSRKGGLDRKGLVMGCHRGIVARHRDVCPALAGGVRNAHIGRGPLDERNGRAVSGTDLPVGSYQIYLVARKELSASIRVLDTGAGKLAVPGRHRIGCALAVRDIAVGRILIDRIGAGVEAPSSKKGTAGVTALLPLDLHIANLGQGRSSPHRINAIAVSAIISGLCHVDLNRTVGVDGHLFICIQTVAAVAASRIARRSAGDVHGGISGDGDVFLRVNAVGSLVGARAIVRHVDGHFGISLDRHIAGLIAGTKTGLDTDCGIGAA